MTMVWNHGMPTEEILGEENEQIDEDNDDHTEFVLPMTTSEPCENRVMEPVGYIKSPFKFKNGTPRQPSICQHARGILTIEKNIFNNPEHSLEGLEEYSHVWIIFVFHKNNNAYTKAKVKPPRLNGKKVGLFSTRSPYRPNPIGLTLAKLDRIVGATIHLSRIDLLDGTPILDIKPYIPQYDSPQVAITGSHQVNDMQFTVSQVNDVITDSQVNDVVITDSQVNDVVITDSRVNDSRTTDSQVNDSRTTDSQVNDVVITDSRVNDSRTTDSQVNDSRTTDSRVNDSRTTDSRVNDVVITDSRVNDSRTTVSPVNDTRTTDSQGNDYRTTDSQGNDSRTTDSQGNDSRTTDSQGNDSRTTDSQVIDKLHITNYDHMSVSADMMMTDPQQVGDHDVICYSNKEMIVEDPTDQPFALIHEESVFNMSRLFCSGRSCDVSENPEPSMIHMHEMIPTSIDSERGNVYNHVITSVSDHTLSDSDGTVDCCGSVTTNLNVGEQQTLHEARDTRHNLLIHDTGKQPRVPCFTENSDIADWVKIPLVSQLQVRFTATAECQLTMFTCETENLDHRLTYLCSTEEARQAIIDILQEDPRSTYRRKHCDDSLYYFAVDCLHVTCWFDMNIAEILRIKPVSQVEQCQRKEFD